MRRYILILCVLFSFFNANGTIVPSSNRTIEEPVSFKIIKPAFDPANAKIKDVKKLLGRKMKLKEKIAFKIFQWKLKKGFIAKEEKPKHDKGKTAMIFGIIAMASAIIPYIGGISFIVFTILALVFGYQAKKENPEDRKAKTAIILGWIGVGLFVLALAVVIAVLASWGGWGWG